MFHSKTDPYFPENLADYAPWVARHGLTAPYGKCQCCCGEDAPIANRISTPRGHKKGEPVRFMQGHQFIKERASIDESNLPPGTCAIPLTRGQYAIVDAEDYEELSLYNWYALRNGHTWYANRADGETNIFMHRQIMDAPQGIEIDHIDRNGLNNTRANLRFATRGQNSTNTRLPKNNTSGFRGVTVHRWQARITVNGKEIYLGYFYDPEEAARAYDAAAKKYHGEFASLNFPDALE